MDLLTSCYLFKNMPSSQIDELAGMARERSIEKEAWLFHEGEAAERLFFLVSGSIELLTTIDNRIELPITRLNASGDCFGTGSLVEPFQYSLSARCVETAELLTIRRVDVSAMEEKKYNFKGVLMKNLAAHYLSRLKETRQELKIHFKILFKAMRI